MYLLKCYRISLPSLNKSTCSSRPLYSTENYLTLALPPPSAAMAKTHSSFPASGPKWKSWLVLFDWAFLFWLVSATWNYSFLQSFLLSYAVFLAAITKRQRRAVSARNCASALDENHMPRTAGVEVSHSRIAHGADAVIHKFPVSLFSTAVNKTGSDVRSLKSWMSRR